MTKLSAATIAKIRTAIFKAASSTNAWAQASAEYRQGRLSKPNETYVKYYYRDYQLDLIETAKIIEGKKIRVPSKLYLTPASELLQTFASSVMHSEIIKTNLYSVQVRNIEALIAANIKPVEQYVDIYVGEYEDKDYGCSRREIIIHVKSEYYAKVPLAMHHTLVDKNLIDTATSRRIRHSKDIFNC